MRAYSADMRERVLRAVDEGKPRTEIIAYFHVSRATIKRYLKQRRETGNVQPQPIPGRTPRKGAALREGIEELLQERGDALCWLHEISAEEIESFPLHLPDLLTAEMNMEWGSRGMLLPSQVETHWAWHKRLWFVPSIKENNKKLLAGSQHNDNSGSWGSLLMTQEVSPSTLKKFMHLGGSHGVILYRIASRKSSYLLFKPVCIQDFARVFPSRAWLCSPSLELKHHMR
jgi:hypothetical protein